MLSKVSVKGSDTTPLYQYLTDTKAKSEDRRRDQVELHQIPVVDRQGSIVARFEPEVTPDSPQGSQRDRTSAWQVGADSGLQPIPLCQGSALGFAAVLRGYPRDAVSTCIHKAQIPIMTAVRTL